MGGVCGDRWCLWLSVALGCVCVYRWSMRLLEVFVGVVSDRLTQSLSQSLVFYSGSLCFLSLSLSVM